ncbi:MAG: TetR/AcrR family transcriptional regulator [Frankiales bacterium]|nr:TetR/AcrR family transcriptional regulator [Frankiales bacterium]
MTSPLRALQAVPTTGESSRERILRVATELFAANGFDGVTTRAIATAAGLNIATVAHHTGSKGQLYDAVFARLHAHENAMLDALLAPVTDADLADPVRVREVLHGLVDAYVDVLAAEPAIAGLWTRRWLERPGASPTVEERFARPLFDRVEALLRKAQDAGSLPALDAHLAVKSVIWITYGYFTGGLVEPVAAQDLADPAQVARLRAFVQRVVDGLVGAP